MKSNVKQSLDSLKLSDIYSLMLFILFKVKEIPEYAVLSELCYLLDGRSITRILTYFAGRTITIPSEADFVILTNALLLYQYVNLDNMPFAIAIEKLDQSLTNTQKDKITELYLQIIPIIAEYNIDRGQVKSNG